MIELALVALGAWALFGGKKKSEPLATIPEDDSPEPVAVEVVEEPAAAPSRPLPPAAVKAEVERIVRESDEIMHGKRDSYSDPPEDDEPAVVPKGVTPVPVVVEVPPTEAQEKAAVVPGVTVEEVLEERAPAAAAMELAEFARAMLGAKRGGELGTKAKPSERVAALQRELGVKPDGIYGPATRKAGEALGVKMPVRR